MRVRRIARVAHVVLAGVLAVGVVTLLVFGVLKAAPNRSIDQAIADGKPPTAPTYRLEVVHVGVLGKRLESRLGNLRVGAEFDSRHLIGTPYLVNFWASWCTGCAEEAVALGRIWQRGRARGILVLGVDVQDLVGDARSYMSEHRVSFPNVRDAGGDQLARYGVTALPETFAVDARGRIVDHIIGVATEDRLRDAVRMARTVPEGSAASSG